MLSMGRLLCLHPRGLILAIRYNLVGRFDKEGDVAFEDFRGN